MKELVIISGKGGTGKTSVTAALAELADNAVLADCDVDAADLHLILQPEEISAHEFRCGNEAVIRADRCVRCGRCLEYCRFEAVKAAPDGALSIDPTACEGCGVCVRFCPVKAIDFPERNCGDWFVSSTRCGPLVHARMRPGAENSGKLVTTVRKAARDLAKERGSDILLVDGPPGIGCPVIAAISGADAVLVVTEPTVSGEHDLGRVLELARHFELAPLVCVNKWDLNPEATRRMEKQAAAAGAVPAGRLPYDNIFTAAQVQGKSVIAFPDSAAAQSVQQLWECICRKR